MTLVIADPALQSLFAGLKERAEVRGDQGNVLGYLTPREVEVELLYQHAERVFNADELRRLSEQQPTGFSIEEVMDYLHSLEKP